MRFSHQELVDEFVDLRKTVRLMHRINQHQQMQIDYLMACHDFRQKKATEKLEEMGTAAKAFDFDFEKKYCRSCTEGKTSNKSKQ